MGDRTSKPTNDIVNITDEARVEKLEEEYLDGLEELTPKMQRFVHLYSTGHYTLAKLSTLLEVHPNTLGKWLKRDDVKKVLTNMQEVTHQIVGIQIRSMSSLAVERLQKLMSSPIDGVALQAVKDVLDRSGHKPRQEIKVDKTVITYEEKLSQLIDNTIVDEELVDDAITQEEYLAIEGDYSESD